MIARQFQQGHALLLMMSLLATAGSVTLLSWSSPELTPDAEQAMAQRRELLSARQALQVYAALYPTLYGPRGAGPGHLPCPDTTGADGPDPPCGRQRQATGRLPGQVSLPARRYAFIEQPGIQPGYHVDASLINNPTNRIVNVGRLDATGLETPFVVRVFTQPGESSGQAVLFPDRRTVPLDERQAVLSVNALKPGVLAMVRLWLRSRLAISVSEECSVAQGRGERLLLRISDPVGADEPSPCAGATTFEQLLSRLHMEDVPARTHWFVRNRWHEELGWQDSAEVTP